VAVLAIDTAGPVVGVFLDGVESPFLYTERITRGAEITVSVAIDKAIKGVSLSHVVVTVGPGAFTSLRVGVAMALGVATARGCKVSQVSSLKARGAIEPTGLTLAMLDGRKGRAYTALYEDGVQITDELDVDPQVAVNLAEGRPFVAVGEGAEVWRELVEAHGGTVSAEACRPPLSEMVAISKQGELVEPQEVILNYIREADAKLPKSSGVNNG
jgi:tRNA threonylcarbamoyladenosine biosynthesis protein TsaB